VRWPHAAAVAESFLAVARDAVPDVDEEAARLNVGTVGFDSCCGQISVSIDSQGRAVSFPAGVGNQLTAIAAGCYEGAIYLALRITVVRCIPVMDDRGNPPEAAAVNEAVTQLYVDAAAIWNALSGPLPDDEWARAALAQTPVSEQGGCIGIDTTVLIGLDQETWGD
jgi:hypothetical protein